MKNLLLALTIGLFISAPAHALLGFSIGAHAGVMDIDNDSIDPAAIVGANVGYEVFSVPLVVAFNADLEVQKSASDFESNAGDFSYDSRGLYLTAKTVGPLYAIGRVGIVDADFEGAGIGGSVSDKATVTTIGAGFSIGTQMELTLSNYSFDDIPDDVQQLNFRIGF